MVDWKEEGRVLMRGEQGNGGTGGVGLVNRIATNAVAF